jgi:phage gp46-like protein
MPWGSSIWGEFYWGGGSIYPTDGEYTYINDSGDFELRGGELVRDKTLDTRCRFRLLCRRGKWVYDSNFGSRFWQIKDLREAKRNAQKYATEALQPLIDSGEVTAVTVIEVDTDALTGFVFANIVIDTPQKNGLQLGTFKVGS